MAFWFMKHAARLACQPVDVTRYVSLIIGCVYLTMPRIGVFNYFWLTSRSVVIGRDLKICLTAALLNDAFLIVVIDSSTRKFSARQIRCLTDIYRSHYMFSVYLVYILSLL